MASTAVRVQPGSFLTLHYRLAGPAGDIVNTFEGKPSTLSLGAGVLSPVLEERLIGLEEGERARFEIPAGQAFGERNPDMVQWVARKLLVQLGDPHETYNVGDVVSSSVRTAMATASPMPCCSISTIRSPASPSPSRCK